MLQFPRRSISSAIAALAIVASAPLLAAPICADKAIKMVIPQPAGGVGDVVARIIGEKAALLLEQPMIYDNRPGASTTIGTALAAAAKPDGCTLLHMTTTAVVASAIRDALPYNIERDLVPVVGIGSFPLALTVLESSKFKTVADLIAAAKAGDGLNYSTGGTGSMGHLSALRLLRESGTKGTHVPYKGNAPALQGLLASDVHFMFPSTFEALPLQQGGKVRVLAVTSESRLPSFAQVPTMKELGFADFAPRIWYVFLMPTATSPQVVQRVQEAFAKALADPAIAANLNARGFITEVRNSAEAATFLRTESARWKKVVQDNGIKSLD
ncbi:MAG: tripartite tricarboxylate transporter substrate binding protein [Rhodoferax sp.]|nr:tripartite tricarboxylate transporter substrate binding protein [Rhodoferax sp.]